MKVKIRSYKGKELHAGIKLALDSRLYVLGWESGMGQVFRDALDGHNYQRASLIIIAFADGKPVGVAMVLEGDRLWLFVRKAFRHQGIGRSMYKTAMKLKERKRNFIVYQTIRNYKFFGKFGIKRPEYFW